MTSLVVTLGRADYRFGISKVAIDLEQKLSECTGGQPSSIDRNAVLTRQNKRDYVHEMKPPFI